MGGGKAQSSNFGPKIVVWNKSCVPAHCHDAKVFLTNILSKPSQNVKVLL